MLAPQKQNLICSPTKTKAQGVIRRTSELKQLGNIQTQFHPIAWIVIYGQKKDKHFEIVQFINLSVLL